MEKGDKGCIYSELHKVTLAINQVTAMNLCALFFGATWMIDKQGMERDHVYHSHASNFRKLYKLLDLDGRKKFREEIEEFKDNPTEAFDQYIEFLNEQKGKLDL